MNLKGRIEAATVAEGQVGTVATTSRITMTNAFQVRAVGATVPNRTVLVEKDIRTIRPQPWKVDEECLNGSRVDADGKRNIRIRTVTLNSSDITTLSTCRVIACVKEREKESA